MPEAPDLESRWGCRLGAGLGDHLVAQGSIKRSQQQSDQSRDDRNGDSLAEAEALDRVLHRAILQFANCFVADSGRLNAVVTTRVFEWGAPLRPLWRGNSEIGAFPARRPSGIQVLIMSTHKIAFTSRDYSLPRSGSKPTLDDKLDRVFQMAEHVDARCVYMLDAATHKRRSGLSAR